MKRFLLALSLVMFTLAFCCADAQAWNGVAVRAVRFPIARAIVSPRVAIVRQPVIVAPVVQPFVVRQRFAAPLIAPQIYVQPQAFVVPQVQSFSCQQSFVMPQVQVQAFSSGCNSAAFFSY